MIIFDKKFLHDISFRSYPQKAVVLRSFKSGPSGRNVRARDTNDGMRVYRDCGRNLL
jgi:hypothetical protein